MGMSPRIPGVSYGIGKWSTQQLRQWIQQNARQVLPSTLSQDINADSVVINSNISLGNQVIAQLKALLGGGLVVATTVTGLGAASAGAQGLIRAGSSPYDMIGVTYDATYNKWVSAPIFVGSFEGVGVSGMSWAKISPAMRFAWGSLNTAGLKVQARGFIDAYDTSNAQDGCYGRFVTYHNTTPNLDSSGTNAVAVGLTNFGSMNYTSHTAGMIDWTDLGITADTYASVHLEGSTQDGNGHGGTFAGSLWVRFTS